MKEDDTSPVELDSIPTKYAKLVRARTSSLSDTIRKYPSTILESLVDSIFPSTLPTPSLWGKRMRAVVYSIRKAISTLPIEPASHATLLLPTIPRLVTEGIESCSFRINNNVTAAWYWPADLMPNLSGLKWKAASLFRPVHYYDDFLSHIRSNRVVLFVHGGAYLAMHKGTYVYQGLAYDIAKKSNCVVFNIDYRPVTSTDIVGIVDDVVSAYMFLIGLGVDTKDVLVCGDSAGAALCIQLLIRLRDTKRALPHGAALISPWVDLDYSRDRETIPEAAFDYCNPGPERYQLLCDIVVGERAKDDPMVSPLYADLSDLPPIFLQYGEYEVFRPHIEDFINRIRKSGGSVSSEMIPQMPHVPHFFAMLARPALLAVDHLCAYIRDPDTVLPNIWEQLKENQSTDEDSSPREEDDTEYDTVASSTDEPI